LHKVVSHFLKLPIGVNNVDGFAFSRLCGFVVDVRVPCCGDVMIPLTADERDPRVLTQLELKLGCHFLAYALSLK